MYVRDCANSTTDEEYYGSYGANTGEIRGNGYKGSWRITKKSNEEGGRDTYFVCTYKRVNDAELS